MNSRRHLVEVSPPGAVTRRKMQAAESLISGIGSGHYVVSVDNVYHGERTLNSSVYSFTLLDSTSTYGTRCDAKEGDTNQHIIFQKDYYCRHWSCSWFCCCVIALYCRYY